MKILHIAAHLGGGAGKAISGIAIQSQWDFGDEHRILLLQVPEKESHVQACRENHIPVALWSGDRTWLQWADVLVISWWNHPTMARFLREFPSSAPATVLWSHINGCYYPFLSAQLAEAFRGVLFTSPYALNNRIWTEEERQKIYGRAEIVYGMGQFDAARIAAKTCSPSAGEFVAGYVGTLNYGKLHPEFVSFCEAAVAQTPNIRFVMAGDRDASLERDIQAAGLWDRFAFPGFVSDVPALMRTFDVFGYLLNPEHYGTTENVLLEAMACGLPCVVLRQNVEQFIVPPGEAFTVSSPAEYGRRLAFLYRYPKERKRLGQESRNHVLAQYSAEENAARFHAACARAAAEPQGRHDFSFLGDTPWQWFLYCLDNENHRRFEAAANQPDESIREVVCTCPPILRERRKSSLRHFAAVYPEDKTLQLFDQWMEETEYGGI